MIKKISENIFTAAYNDLSLDNSYNFCDNEIVDVRHLVDRAGNSLDCLLQLVMKADDVLRSQGRVVVACDMGISRSRVVAIGLLTKLGLQIDESISHVMEVCNYPEINAELLLLLKQNFNHNSQNPKFKSDVVILGSGGFIGASLVSFLKNEGLAVKAVDRKQLDLRIDHLKLIDILQNFEPKVVIICAHPQAHHTANALGCSLHMLKNVLEACRLTSTNLLYISGMVVFNGSAFKEKRIEFIAHENDNPIPRGTYSESKFLGEKLVHLYNINYNMNNSIIRPCGLYGPGMRSEWLIPKLIAAALKNKNIETHNYANGKPQLELLHIDDFCSAVCKLINLDSKINCYNVGSHKLIDTNSLASMIVEITGSKSSLKLININENIYNVVSSSGLIEHTGWCPRIPLDSGLKKYIESVASINVMASNNGGVVP